MSSIRISGGFATLGSVVNVHGVGDLDGQYRVAGHIPGGELELQRVEDNANAVSWSLPRMGKITADWMGLRMWVTPGVGPWLWSMARGGVVQRKGKADTEIGAQIEAAMAAKRFIKEQAELVDKLDAWGPPLSDEAVEKLTEFCANPRTNRIMIKPGVTTRRAAMADAVARLIHGAPDGGPIKMVFPDDETAETFLDLVRARLLELEREWHGCAACGGLPEYGELRERGRRDPIDTVWQCPKCIHLNIAPEMVCDGQHEPCSKCGTTVEMYLRVVDDDPGPGA